MRFNNMTEIELSDNTITLYSSNKDKTVNKTLTVEYTPKLNNMYDRRFTFTLEREYVVEQYGATKKAEYCCSPFESNDIEFAFEESSPALKLKYIDSHPIDHTITKHKFTIDGNLIKIASIGDFDIRLKFKLTNKQLDALKSFIANHN